MIRKGSEKHFLEEAAFDMTDGSRVRDLKVEGWQRKMYLKIGLNKVAGVLGGLGC